MVSKVRNVRSGVFSGCGCHHPNKLSFADADVIIAVTMAEFFITPKPALDKFPSHFRIFGVEGSTLQDLMDNAGSYDPPKMT